MTDYSIDIIKDTSYTIELNEQGPQGIQGERGMQGPEGPVGPKGDKGDVGKKGDTGVSVVGVEEVSKVGLVTTYRMLFSNGEYFDYQVTDGSIDGLTRETIINIIGYEPASYTSVEGLTTRISTLEESFTDIQTSLDNKQDKLTAGENITIVDNVISAKGGGSGLEVCDIGMALYVDETKGLRRYLNGQIVDINTNTQAFLNRLKQITTLYPSLLCTEDEWQTAKTMSVFGQVGKFVFNYSGNEVVSVRLPRVVNVQGLFDLQNLGMTVEAGLPNIKTNSYYTRGNMWSTYNYEYTNGPFRGKASLYYYNIASDTANNHDRFIDLDFDASRSNPIYGNSNTVQPEAIQYPYFIQIATGQETENNIVNEIELNNPSFFGDSKYVPTKVNNLSWLKSEGQNNPKGAYHSFYDWILENVNKGVDKFKTNSSYCYKKQDSDYGVWTNSVAPAIGMSVYGHTPMQQIGTISALVKNGFTYYDTKLKADTTVYRYTSADNRADYITDYDFVINTTDETFRLPLLNGDENKLGKFEPIPLPAFGSDFSSPYVNGMYEIFASRSTDDGYLYIANRTIDFEYDNNTPTDGWGRVHCPASLGDTIYIGTNIPEGGQRFARYAKYIGNGSLYYYVGETVQNANLIDAGRIGEQLATKTDMQQASGASMPSGRYIDLTLGASDIPYKAPADGYFCFRGNATAARQYVYIGDNNYKKVAFQGTATGAGDWIVFTVPVKKNESILINYNTGANNALTFIYAEGSK